MSTHNHGHDHSVSTIKIAFLLNFTFTIIEIIAGFLFNSMAILSDALHDLGDSFSLGLAWFLQRYSGKDSTEQFSYGYQRYSLLSAFINAIVLISGSLLILYHAIPRVLNPQQTNAQGMIGIAIIGIIVNGYAVYQAKGGKSLNEKVISWHLLEDVLGWIAVLIVGIIMYYKEIYLLDPLVSILITLFILYNILKKMKETVLLFLQAVPKDVDLTVINEQLMAIDHVMDTHHTHIWSLDSEHHVLTTHLVVESGITMDDYVKIKQEAKKICQTLPIEHLTIEIDMDDEVCDYK